jgi:hypothetical protein
MPILKILYIIKIQVFNELQIDLQQYCSISTKNKLANSSDVIGQLIILILLYN